MFRGGYWAFLCLVGVSLFGCGSRKVDVPEASKPAVTAKLEAGTWSGKVEQAELTVSLSKDGRFQMVFRGGKFRSVVKGTATIHESTLNLNPTELDGSPVADSNKFETTKLQFSSDWSKLTTDTGASLLRKI